MVNFAKLRYGQFLIKLEFDDRINKFLVVSKNSNHKHSIKEEFNTLKEAMNSFARTIQQVIPKVTPDSYY